MFGTIQNQDKKLLNATRFHGFFLAGWGIALGPKLPPPPPRPAASHNYSTASHLALRTGWPKIINVTYPLILKTLLEHRIKRFFPLKEIPGSQVQKQYSSQLRVLFMPHPVSPSTAISPHFRGPTTTTHWRNSAPKFLRLKPATSKGFSRFKTEQNFKLAPGNFCAIWGSILHSAYFWQKWTGQDSFLTAYENHMTFREANRQPPPPQLNAGKKRHYYYSTQGYVKVHTNNSPPPPNSQSSIQVVPRSFLLSGVGCHLPSIKTDFPLRKKIRAR